MHAQTVVVTIDHQDISVAMTTQSINAPKLSAALPVFPKVGNVAVRVVEYLGNFLERYVHI